MTRLRSLREKLFRLSGLELSTDKGLLTHRQQLRRLLSAYEIDNILDVGANRGQFGSACRNLGYDGLINSFEPLSKPFAILKQRTSLDRRWNVFNIGLGTRGETRNLHVHTRDVFSSLYQHNDFATERFALSNESKQEPVSIESTEEWIGYTTRLEDGNIMLKSDTQGHDLEVLHGAGPRLVDITLVLVELSFLPIYRGTPTWNEVVGFLEQSGFHLVAISPISRKFQDGPIVEANGFFARQ